MRWKRAGCGVKGEHGATHNGHLPSAGVDYTCTAADRDYSRSISLSSELYIGEVEFVVVVDTDILTVLIRLAGHLCRLGFSSACFLMCSLKYHRIERLCLLDTSAITGAFPISSLACYRVIYELHKRTGGHGLLSRAGQQIHAIPRHRSDSIQSLSFFVFHGPSSPYSATLHRAHLHIHEQSQYIRNTSPLFKRD